MAGTGAPGFLPADVTLTAKRFPMVLALFGLGALVFFLRR
jgi:hypothetical protein